MSKKRAVDTKQVKLLIREGEGLTVEFKERYTSRISEDIAAFANTRGGMVLIGVKDDGTVKGEHLTNDLRQRSTAWHATVNQPFLLSLHRPGGLWPLLYRKGPKNRIHAVPAITGGSTEIPRK